MTLPSTAWQPGQSGNPNGSIPIKLMRDALMLVLNEPCKDEKFKGIKRLRRVADALVSEAEQGNVLAIKEILDRVDGRVPNDITVRRPNDLPATTFEELAQGVAEALIKLRGAEGKLCDATQHDSETEPLLVENATQQDTQQS